MTKFVPYEKLSKKEKRKVDLARRGTWNVNPVTRMSENPRAYNRKKADKQWREHGAYLPFVLCENVIDGCGEIIDTKEAFSVVFQPLPVSKPYPMK